MSIVLHIERLVIDEALLGGERVDNVRAALQCELVRQLRTPGAIHVLREIGTLSTLPTVALSPADGWHDRLGTRIASTVGHGLGLTASPHLAGKER